MGWWMMMVITVFLNIEDGFSLTTIIPVGMGKTLTYNGLRQMGSIVVQ